MKIYIKHETVWLCAILITPFIDTINGFFLFVNGVSGVTDSTSIGAVYRILVMVLMCYFIFGKGIRREKFILLLSLTYFPFKAIIQGLIEGAFFSFLSYALKWIYPILLMEGFCAVYRYTPDNGKRCLHMIINFFSWSFAVLLIVEYILGLGRVTYYDAGFKGLFYSTNDISFCLTVGGIYQIFIFFERHSIKHILYSVLNLIALVILAAKSGFAFIAFALVYCIFYKGIIYRKKFMYVGILLVMGVVGVLFIKSQFGLEIQEMMLRYRNMFENSMNKRGTFDGIMTFLTSGRTQRINSFLSRLRETRPIIIHFLTGWIRPDNGTVIEMDFHDLFCQYGFIGLWILGRYYLKIFGKSSGDKKYKLLYLTSMISAVLGGHIISAALSGTVLAVIICFLYTGDMVRNEKYVKI